MLCERQLYNYIENSVGHLKNHTLFGLFGFDITHYSQVLNSEMPLHPEAIHSNGFYETSKSNVN